MILPPLAEDYNERFPTITRAYFDDHQVRREHALQLRLKQLAPPMLDGGRAILWFCHLCQKPWYELGRTASFVCLSTSQLAEIAQQLGAEVQRYILITLVDLSSVRISPSRRHAQDRGVSRRARLSLHLGGDNVTQYTFILYSIYLEHRFYIGHAFGSMLCSL